MLFPFVEYWWFYASFLLFVMGMLALDLGVFHKKAHEVSFKEASIWTVVWFSLALVFNWFLYLYSLTKFSEPVARQVGLEFLTGFIVEKSLAVDNIFIFAVVFSYFAVPKIYQHRILFYGILGALVFRGIFVALGTWLMNYKWVVLFFGVLLILTGIKMLFSSNETINPEANFIVKFLKKHFRVYPKIESDAFFVKRDGAIFITPLLIALVFLEATDIIFAIDSVPAIFALTKEPLIVFTSNIFAILGLRSMYFMLSGVLDRFYLIKYGLAGVLVFVGLKMAYLNEAFGGKFPLTWSLAIIGGLIGTSVLLSLVFSRNKVMTELKSE